MPPQFTPRTLAQWPWVVVRLDCVLCRRRGCYRLARLAAKYGPEQSIGGLLRDLAHDCPWYNERPRKYEPRCGARFTDLEHAFPPADHPEEPVYRRRQPSREDLPKPGSANRFPATYTGGALTLADWQGDEMVLACRDCGRCDMHKLADLRSRITPGTLLVNLRVALSADCPRRQGALATIQCGALIVAADRNGTPSE